MIRRILLATLCLTLVFNSFAQKTTTAKEKKPSKQETMDWIAGKMKENLTGGREFVSYIDGKFSYKKEWKTSIYCVTTIDLNNVLGMNSEYSADFFVSGKNLTFVHCDNDKPDQGSYKEYLSISGPNYKDYTAPFNFTPDATLVERLKKAVAVLIQYNAPKKGENESF